MGRNGELITSLIEMREQRWEIDFDEECAETLSDDAIYSTRICGTLTRPLLLVVRRPFEVNSSWYSMRLLSRSISNFRTYSFKKIISISYHNA